MNNIIRSSAIEVQMDKVRQLRKNEIDALGIASLVRKCQDLYFIADYHHLKPLEECSLAEIYEMLKEKRPLIEIYVGMEEGGEQE